MAYRVILIGDSAGYGYKNMIKEMLTGDPRVSEVIDAGMNEGETPDLYPNLATAAAERIARGEADRGIFVCGTGMGVAMSACKVKGIRASVAHDSYSVERLVKSNNAQILCLGQRVIGPELAKRLASEFLDYEFDPASHSKANVDAICAYDGSLEK
ncbi:ribose 5-phosphate isomerase B [Actinobaculum suis]|uniref:D-erythrulose 4-phosphate isomerase n=1 Tax=Actinobaculum suis TaxID=1657 RepID=A0A0K9ESB2_9ACTO|nr:ribose-5-phosphate isomerase [Actinobaculum suis]KMY22761.1 ribose 5-phosphate isomerase [Actinobaculum suis]MDY5152892.1 ribose-5-phosphate isomerase [Actinobaculum suis]SDE55626.1 ribose 5-phosphate isomerase B [Actinobaculum suis]